MYIQSELSSLCRLIALKSEKRAQDWLESKGICISSEQAITIMAISKENELRQGDLMGMPYLASEKSKVSRIVQSLVMEGYILRRDDLNDRRSKILTLTDKGLSMSEQLEQTEHFNRELVSNLFSQEEMYTIQTSLQRIASVM
ncbi:MarR family winged helix-turn-helix transcriptional regulator [Enterovibrio calviensis]|uniref:MarR family winged helix-turn-helix transcriptional regulator n=1 Tax=Enterovibrio calviensis TaxID=91359 RepID=UPI000489CDCE|nr:winged helix DNA-binding protein [Enterovibrio calviensis]